MTRFKKWWSEQWKVNPPVETDVVGVAFLRKFEDGSVWEFKLEGEEATKWGFLFNNRVWNKYNGSDPRLDIRFDDLKWIKRKIS